MEQNCVIMRHAHYYDGNQEISEYGQVQISNAAKKLNDFFYTKQNFGIPNLALATKTSTFDW